MPAAAATRSPATAGTRAARSATTASSRQGSGNDAFALGYYDGDDLPFTEQLARRFTVFDHWHASLLGPTFPNRQYLHAAQSGGHKDDSRPVAPGMLHTARRSGTGLRRAKVAVGVLLHRPPDRCCSGASGMYAAHARSTSTSTTRAPGKLAERRHGRPGVPVGAHRTDDHPHGDIRAGAALRARRVPGVRAVAAVGARRCSSLHLRRVGRLLRPRRAAGRRPTTARAPIDDDELRRRPGSASRRDRGVAVRAAGLRRPHASTTTRRSCGSSSGASSARPPRAPRRQRAWWLTERDRHAANLGATLTAEPQVDLGFDITMDLPAPRRSVHVRREGRGVTGRSLRQLAGDGGSPGLAVQRVGRKHRGVTRPDGWRSRERGLPTVVLVPTGRRAGASWLRRRSGRVRARPSGCRRVSAPRAPTSRDGR